MRSPKSNRDFLVVYLYIYGGWKVDFKTYKVTYTADLVSHGHINVTLLAELIDNALRSEAGKIGYLVGDSRTVLDGENDE